MKQILFSIIFLFIIVRGISQTNPQFSTFTRDIDSFLTHIDKSPISTGILYDRVYPFTNLPFFNITQSLPDTIDFPFYLQACSEIRRAAYGNNPSLPPVSDSFYNAEKKSKLSRVVKIGAFSYNYNFIDTNSLINNQVYFGSVDSALYDSPNRINSPFILRRTNLVSPIISTLDYSAGPFTFKLDEVFYNTNTGLLINYINIDFNDGNGFVSFNNNATYTPLYTTDGMVYCKAIIYLSDGSSSTNYFSLNITNAGQANRIGVLNPDEEISFLATRGFTGYDETIMRFAQANIGIYYADQTIGTVKRMQRPIIISDGVDFTQRVRFREFNVEYLQYFNQNNTQTSLIDQLNLQGYDVILVDYDAVTDAAVLLPNRPLFDQPGADYVERNAMVMVDILQWANNELAAQNINEQLVVIGPSMGGLVTRFALRWMELNNLAHNTRLWISFDAPHRGANIPIGSQYTIDFYATYGKNEGAIRSRDQRLNAPAAKQFIIHHYLANSVAQAGAPDFRNRFNTAIEALGWPQAPGLRRVSLANGTLNGALTHLPEAKSFEVEGKPKNFGGQLLVFYFHMGRQRVIGNESYFTSNSTLAKRCFYGYKFKPFTNSNYYTKVASTPSGSCSLDNAPGGKYPTQQDIALQIPPTTETESGTVIGLKVLAVINDNCFIPTKSALGNFNFINWCENITNRNLSCSNEIPFDNYYAPVSNSENHVFLSLGGVNWMFNELAGTPLVPPVNYNQAFPIQPISGSEPICNTTTYGVNNLPTGATVTWAVDDFSIATINPSTGAVTRVANGEIIITATVNSICGNFSITRGVFVGVQPSPVGTINTLYDPTQTCFRSGQYYTFIFNFTDPGTSGGMLRWGYYDTYTGNINNPIHSEVNSYYDAVFWFPGNYTVFVRSNSICGNSSGILKEIVVEENCGFGFMISTSPNPVQEEVRVATVNESAEVKQIGKHEIITIELYDFLTRQLIKTWKVKNETNEHRLNLEGIKKGKYVIKVTKGKFINAKQLIVE